MKGVLGLSLFLLAGACEEQKKAGPARSYHEQGAVDAAHTAIAREVKDLNLTASTAHNEWMRVESINFELKKEKREKELADLNKELVDATTAKEDSAKAYAEQLQRIDEALKSARLLLGADAKPVSLKTLDEDVKSTEHLLSEVEKWRRLVDDAANKYLETTDPELQMDAQREYYKLVRQHWDLK